MGIIIQGKNDLATVKRVVRSVYEFRHFGRTTDISRLTQTYAAHLVNVIPHATRNVEFEAAITAARTRGNCDEADTLVRPSLPVRTEPYPASEVTAEATRNTLAQRRVTAATARDTLSAVATQAAARVTAVDRTTGSGFDNFIAAVARELLAGRPLLRIRVSDFHFADSARLNTDGCQVELINEADAVVGVPFWYHHHPALSMSDASFKDQKAGGPSRRTRAPYLVTPRPAAEVTLLSIVHHLMGKIKPAYKLSYMKDGKTTMPRGRAPATTVTTYTGCTHDELTYTWFS